MKYFLEISDISDKSDKSDGPLRVIAQGDEEADGLRLTYPFDGAKYILALSPRIIVHERQGETQMRMEFVRGVQTLCKISCGGQSGGFTLFTREMRVDFSGGQCAAEVEYTFEGETSPVKKRIFVREIK